jgi:hypothetical protein
MSKERRSGYSQAKAAKRRKKGIVISYVSRLAA